MQKQPQVIKKVVRKKGASVHHGGSWKVAYADFVTAMMAFFLVMWIISMDQPVREKIQNYFNNPLSASNSRPGISTLADGGRSPIGMGHDTGIDDRGWREVALTASKVAHQAQKDRLRRIQKSLQQKIARRPELAKLARQIAFRNIDDGLAIDLLQVQEASFFETASAVPTPAARRVMAILGQELGRLPLPIRLEGHTDVRPFRGRTAYSNWELSADRANAVRRELERSGVRPGQVEQVTGLAATRLRDPKNPTSAANRRVTIFVAIQADDQSAPPGPALGDGNPLADGPPASEKHGPAFRLGIRPREVSNRTR